jgi:hypothetical protein
MDVIFIQGMVAFAATMSTRIGGDSLQDIPRTYLNLFPQLGQAINVIEARRKHPITIRPG